MTISSGEDYAVLIKDKGRIKLQISPARFIDEEHEESKSEAIQQVSYDQSNSNKSKKGHKLKKLVLKSKKLLSNYIDNINMTANEGLLY